MAATVLSVESGNTLRVRDGGMVRTIRLACLDAPEPAQAPHGARALAALRQLLPAGTAVRLTPLASGNASSGEVVAEVATPTALVNVELVRAGQAFSTPEAQSGCDALPYADAENTARFRRLGVWQVEGGTERPWLWRIARADAQARAKRQREVEAQQRQARAQRAARLNASRPLREASWSSGPSLSSPEFQKQCVALSRKQFLEHSMGVPPPPGSMEQLCSCIAKGRQGETSPLALAERCATRVMERLQTSL
jgi:endonuclease YncB( thermonuclease family)